MSETVDRAPEYRCDRPARLSATQRSKRRSEPITSGHGTSRLRHAIGLLNRHLVCNSVLVPVTILSLRCQESSLPPMPDHPKIPI
jgi:hypothetical protein